MILVLVTALIAVCGADKLDRTYLPPASASTAGGTSGSLQTPLKTFNQGLGGLPKGSYSNEFEGIIVDAVAPGSRASGSEETGLGGQRIAYGSTDSKVGEAAFTADTAFPRVSVNSGSNTQGAIGADNSRPINFESRPERIQSSRDRISNTVKYESEVSPDKFNYAFETDNGIIAEENGIEVNGVKAQGGYSYTGDDGQVYSVTYTADEGGYRPKGDHLPTPPPIPVEILESLEKNAQDEAAGIVDDGSYNAQKYNAGEDYTKSDNGQYNSGQTSQLGNRPQSDAVASGSFISQNNQGFVRPNSQFVTNPSLDALENTAATGNTFGVTNSAINSAQNAQTFGFGAPSKNEYLPPNNVFNQNKRPGFNGVHGIQSGVQSGVPTFSSTTNSDNSKNQNTEIPTFIPLAQQKLQENKPKRPQSNSPIFGKPTVIDSTLSIRDPFAKRPSSNRFTLNKDSNQKPQAVGGSFEVVSGNVFSSKNEYLPPRRQSNKPNQNNGNERFPSINFGKETNQRLTDAQLFSPNSPTASVFASVSQPSTGFQSSQPSQQYNGQLTPQHTGINLHNQFSHTSNNRPVLQGQSSSLGSNIPSVPSFNRSPVSQFENRPSTFASQSPTLQPQTELTTPLQSNPDVNKVSAPIPIIDGPDSVSLTSASGSTSYGSKPTNSFVGQNGFNVNTIQQASPTQASASVISTQRHQSLAPGSQNTPEFGNPAGNLALQSRPDEQYSHSTQRPSFNQYNKQQGSDDSYYYNTPSKAFNTPTPRPQASKFPSTSFDQSNKVTQTPFGNKQQFSNAPGSFLISQGNKPADTTRYPNPPPLRPVSPTLPTPQQEQSGNTFQTQFNKLTQASTSAFPSLAPTASGNFHGNQLNQFGSGSFKPVDHSNQDSQSISPQQSSSQPQQQYGGTIYEYNKPPQTLPTPQNGGSSEQVGQTTQFVSSVSVPQITQAQAAGTYKPTSQLGSKFTQQSFGQTPLGPQVSQENQGFNLNSPIPIQQKPGQFNSQSTNPSQNSQLIQGASKFPPAYNKPGPSCCKQLGSPSPTSQTDEKHQGSPQFISQFRPNEDSQQAPDQDTKPIQSVPTFAGVGETFGGPRKPPSFDQTGYHY